MMTHVYSASGTVFQRNEFMKGYSDYERSWTFSEERYMAESLEEATQKIAIACNVHENQYGLVEIRDLKITDLGKLKTRGPVSLQTGKPYNCTTLISVPARNIRSAEGEGFIPMRGAMRCEVSYQGKTWHAKKHDLSAEWFLDCLVGEEPETRKRGRIALEADQTPDKERMMRNTPTEFVYHPIGDDDPNAYGPDDLVHVEVDLEGRSHIWPYTSEMHDRRYHPEWMPGYVEPGRSERPK